MAQSTTAGRIGKTKARQLSLFPEKIRTAYMVADSPRKAFYRIWIEVNAGIYSVIKESGIGDNVLDKRSWTFNSVDTAKALYDRRIKNKTNHNLKRTRKYTLVYSI